MSQIIGEPGPTAPPPPCYSPEESEQFHTLVREMNGYVNRTSSSFAFRSQLFSLISFPQLSLFVAIHRKAVSVMKCDDHMFMLVSPILLSHPRYPNHSDRDGGALTFMPWKRHFTSPKENCSNFLLWFLVYFVLRL